MKDVSAGAGYRVFDGNGITGSSTAEYNGYVGILHVASGNNLAISVMKSGTKTDLKTTAETLTAGNYYEASLLWQDSPNNKTMTDLTQSISATYTTDTTYTLSSVTQVSLALGGTNGNEYTTYWYRVRLAPPSNVMPTASFGSITQNYVLAIANSASSSWNVNLGVASSSNTGRLVNVTLWFFSPTSVQIQLGSGVTQITTGPAVSLPGSGTLYIGLYATSSSAGSRTVTLSLEIRAGTNGAYAQYTINLQVN